MNSKAGWRDTSWAIRCVWLRYFDVFRKSFAYYLVTTFLEPLLYLLSFGWGVGSLVGSLHARGVLISYKTFVFSGIVAQTIMFQGFFEASYGAFIRMYYQRVFQSIATTPITLSEVLWGELLWDASKATMAAEMVLIIGALFGSFPWFAPLELLPVVFAGAVLFAAMGLLVAALAKTIEQISYPQYLLIFPMFLFCGVFYPIETLPRQIQWLAWVLPLTSLVSLVRTLTLGFAFEWWSVPSLAAWLIVLVIWSRRAMTARLVK